MSRQSPEVVLKRILRRRGLSGQAAKAFLKPDYSKLRDPFDLPDMSEAVKRIVRAVANKEKVFIYGDYDIDGLCATTILLRAFTSFGLSVSAFIPSRFSDGYGLNATALTKLRVAGADLIISVDCGTTAIEAIAAAAAVGADVIVTDHHEPGPLLPAAAVAVVNPKRADSTYGFSELAGSGVAYKLVQALQTKLSGLSTGQEKWLLDLAAFGTICDVVPLIDENRVLASFGLKVWPQTRWAGLRALAQSSGAGLSRVDARTLGYIFGPRLNAAGRIEHAATALELLTADELTTARAKATTLEGFNAERRQVQEAIERGALAAAESVNDPLLVLADPEWSHGVVGIVASRLMERYAKPVFLAQMLADGTVKGSARSFGDFNAVEALDAVRPLLLSGGGHRAAAGFSLAAAEWPDFVAGLNRHYASLGLNDQTGLLRPQPDLALDDLGSVNLELQAYMSQLEPYGQGNPEPLFSLGPLKVDSARRIGRDQAHLKLRLIDKLGTAVDGVMWRAGEHTPGGDIFVLATLSLNDFGGRQRVELMIKGWQKTRFGLDPKLSQVLPKPPLM